MTKFTHNFLPSFKLERIDGGEKRIYVTPEGNKYISVTSALSSLNKEGILEWRERVGAEHANKVTKHASSRGTRVHKILEKYVLNEEDYLKGQMPLNIEMFNQIKSYLDKHVDLIFGSELQLYSDELKLAGTTDLFCRMHGERAIVDFKTSTYQKKEEWIENYFLQSAAYAIMAEERYDLYVNKFCILIATEQEGLQFFWKDAKEHKQKLRNFLISTGHC
jgi:ATP-dependent exoDNAse (exonuclease V) beta subunit